MYTQYCTGLLTIWWPRWRQFTKFSKWITPIFLHYMEWSVIDFITWNPQRFKSDFASIIFTSSISFALLHFCNILPEAYRPVSRYIDTVIQVIVQSIVTDLLMRTLGTAAHYILYHACINGIVANFVNRYLFFLYIFDGYIPVTKFIRISTTDEGFEQARIALGVVQLIFGIIYSRFYLRLFRIYRKIRCYVGYVLSPVYNELRVLFKGYKKRGRRSKSKRRWCLC